MKIGVVHLNLQAYGGAEYVCFSAIDSLHKNGHQIGLCTNDAVDFRRTLELTGIDLKNSIESIFISKDSHRVPFLRGYNVMLIFYMLHSRLCIQKFWKIFNPDLLMVTHPAPIIPNESVDRTVIYMNRSPIEFRLNRHYKVPEIIWKFYSSPTRIALGAMNEYKNANLVANSRYTARLIKHAWGKNAHVIYPPCPLYHDLPPTRKRNTVCTLSRFAPDKRYEIVLEIARHIPTIYFHLIGTVSKRNWVYLNNLMHKAKLLGNVRFHVNVSFEKKMKILAQSKILLNAKVGEEFGIGLVEAMSLGTIPVPHDSGAAREDEIVPPEFRWEKIEEALSIIRNSIDKWNTKIAKELRRKSKEYGQDRFRQNIVRYINERFPR